MEVFLNCLFYQNDLPALEDRMAACVELDLQLVARQLKPEELS